MHTATRLSRSALALLVAIAFTLIGSLGVLVPLADAQSPVYVVVDATPDPLTNASGMVIATVGLKIPAGTTVAGAFFTLDVDGQFLQFSSQNNLPMCKWAVSYGACGPINPTDSANASFVNWPGLTSSTKLFKIALDAQGQAGCDIPIDFSVVTVLDGSGQPLPTVVVSDTIDIPGPGVTC